MNKIMAAFSLLGFLLAAPSPVPGGNGIASFVNSSGMTGNTQVAGLSGASTSYYITGFSCSGTANATCGLSSSTTASNACATSPAVVVVPTYLPANGGFSLQFANPRKVTANSALCCIPSAGTTSCTVDYVTKPG